MFLWKVSYPVFLSCLTDVYFRRNAPLTCLPITLMQNPSQEKESMRGASSFAEVELKLSTNAAGCEGLDYLLSLENIYIKY